MLTARRYSPEEKAAAVRMVRTLRVELGVTQGTVQRVATQLGYEVESVRMWVMQADIDDGVTTGVSSAEAQRVRELGQENRELRRANEVLKRAGFRMPEDIGRINERRACRSLAGMADSDRVVDPVSQVELLVPPFATPERAIKRAARERAGTLRRIRFYLDGTNPWPFWEEHTDEYMLTPKDLGLSTDLENDLRDWYNSWNANVRYNGEPPDPAWLHPWQARGDELAKRVQEHVWDFAEIIP